MNLVQKIRTAIPDMSLTTDIIVGFPGETEEDFLETMDVVEQVRYDSAFTFIYSKRTGTPAAAMENQIPEEVVKDRFDRLLAKVQEIGREMSSRDTGTIQEVLVEEQNRPDVYPITFWYIFREMCLCWDRFVRYAWMNAEAFTIWAQR